MKVGSLVVVKPFENMILGSFKGLIKWLPIQDESTVYTIRELDPDQPHGIVGVMFEEGVIGFRGKREISLDSDFVREIQTPDDGENVISEALEADLSTVNHLQLN